MTCDDLKTKEFEEAWTEWETHRAEIHKALKPTTVRFQIRKLEKMGHDRAIAAIEFSIEQGYTGLWEPDQKKAKLAEDTTKWGQSPTNQYGHTERFREDLIWRARKANPSLHGLSDEKVYERWLLANGYRLTGPDRRLKGNG